MLRWFSRKSRAANDPPDVGGFAVVYGFELLARQPIVIDEQRVLDHLSAELGDVQRSDARDTNHYFVKDVTVAFQEGHLPSQLVIFPGALEKHNWTGTDAFHQSRRLPDAEQRVAACPHGIFLSDLMSSLLDHRRRRKILAAALRAVIKHSNAELLYAAPITQFLDAKEVLAELSKPEEVANPVYPFLNVRFYRISETAADMIMDTLGLSALGLTDAQIHFRNLDPSRVAGFMESLGRYVLDNGDVLEDGHTVQGLTPQQNWRCRHEMSLLEPKRPVVDINPGPGYAAGNRRVD